MKDLGIVGHAVQNELDRNSGEIAEVSGISRVVLDKKRRPQKPAYVSYCSMLSRCYRPKSNGYRNYGGRGIKVCERWLEGFANFYSDTGDRPEGTTLDRINNEGHYEPGNCRWATRHEQAQNKRGSGITHNGKTLSAFEWAALLGIPKSRLFYRLRQMPIERALDRFPGRRSKHVSHEQAQARANWDAIASIIALKGEAFLNEAT